MTTTYERPVSRTEYLVRERAAEYRSEFYDGQVVAMAGASRSHARIVTNLAMHLGTRLRGGPCEVFVADMRVRIADASAYVYPDVAIACGDARFEDPELDTLLNPSVLVEVLSPSTERADRGRKAQAYRSIESLREYLLVAQDRPRVEVYRRAPAGEPWPCTVIAGPDAVLDLPSVGISIPLAELYERVFPEGAERPPARPETSPLRAGPNR